MATHFGRRARSAGREHVCERGAVAVELVLLAATVWLLLLLLLLLLLPLAAAFVVWRRRQRRRLLFVGTAAARLHKSRRRRVDGSGIPASPSEQLPPVACPSPPLDNGSETLQSGEGRFGGHGEGERPARPLAIHLPPLLHQWRRGRLLVGSGGRLGGGGERGVIRRGGATPGARSTSAASRSVHAIERAGHWSGEQGAVAAVAAAAAAVAAAARDSALGGLASLAQRVGQLAAATSHQPRVTRGAGGDE